MPCSRSVSRGLVIFLVASAPVVVFGLFACDTDNGDTNHGPDIDTLPDSGGRRKLPDGAIVEQDGAPVTDDDDGDDDDDDDGGPGEGCRTGAVAVIAGNDTTLSGAVRAGDAAWQGGPIAGGAAKSKPGLVAIGAGFLAVTRGAEDKLQSLTATAATWTAPQTIGLEGVKGAPSLTVLGDKAHLVYASNTVYKHGIYSSGSTTWDGANAPVGSGPNPGEYSFGANSAGLAAVGNELVFAENGDDKGLYARSYGSAWSGPGGIPVIGAGTIGPNTTATPEIAPISAGKADLVIVYAYKSPTALAYSTRQPNAAGADIKWGNNPGDKFISGALTTTKFSLTAISPTAVILAFRGDDENAYYTQGTAAGDDITWSAPAPIGGALTKVDAAPAVAKGICGDEAVFAYANAGTVNTVALKAGAWSTPAAVPNVTGSNVAIATK